MLCILQGYVGTTQMTGDPASRNGKVMRALSYRMFDLSFKLATFEGASIYFRMQKQKSP